MSRPGGQIDTLELAATLRQRGRTTAVVVPVVREAREPVTIQADDGKTRDGSRHADDPAGPVRGGTRRAPAFFHQDRRATARPPLGSTRSRGRTSRARCRGLARRNARRSKPCECIVSKLRPKLAEIGLRIDTLKGQGYRLGVVPARPVETHVVRERLAAPYRRKGVDPLIPRTGTLHSTGPRRARTTRSGSPWWLAPVPLEPESGWTTSMMSREPMISDESRRRPGARSAMKQGRAASPNPTSVASNTAATLLPRSTTLAPCAWAPSQTAPGTPARLASKPITSWPLELPS